ncbi:glycosyl hydrolase [Pedobacter sp. SYSU D00535]|uniref:glycosyl hydrolase n=1 Tax=Pedobacter sp. SYSU D00535 TaxID=2810308 RepID=UPI001A959658|nr:glycosyl hydrolase [Pedobacter sp. SYSU D00535]
MKKSFIKASLLGAILAAHTFVSAQTKPQWPEITKENKPWSRWWWQGSAVNEKDLSWMLDEYKKAGLGGLEITTIYGVKGAENQFIDFVSPKWMEMLKHTLKEGNRLGLGIDMAQASGWPFGGPWVSDEDASKYVTYKTYTLKGGEKLKESVQFQQAVINRAVGERLDITKIKEPFATTPNLQLHAFDQVRFPKMLPLQALMAYSDKGQVIELTGKVAKNGTLNWTAPAGNWNLYAVFQGWHGKMVERAGPGGEGYAIDHFSKAASTNFLKYFDQAFKGHDISGLRAFFNDSYEVDDAQGEANWTPRFFEEFQARRGYDLRTQLPALFGKDAEEKNKRVLTDYRETVSDLLLENYTQTWHDWAKARGALIRNQAHGSPANILDLYAATDIPEIEGTDIMRIKFASSAANVTGKPLTASESATWENEHFLSKLSDVKKAMDLFLLGGVNHTFYHGTNYTPQNEPFPGWLFYAAVHFTPHNPFWDDFKKLNSYVARVQSFMQRGKPNNDVLLYLPIYDSYSKAGRSLLQHYDGIDHGFKGSSLEESAHALQKKGYSFDFISDRQIYNTALENNQIKTGGVLYKTIVVPQTQFMPLSTLQKLADLARSGATVIFYKNTPTTVPGLGNFYEQRVSDFKHVLGQMRFSATEAAGIQMAALGKGTVLVVDDLDKGLAFGKVEREKMVDQGLQVIRRKHDKGSYYFLVNSSDKAIKGWVPVQSPAASVAIFNPMTGKAGYAALRKGDQNGTEVYLELASAEGLILETSMDVIQGAKYPYMEAAGAAQPVKGDWNIAFVKGGPTLPKAVKTASLTSWTDFSVEGLKDFSGTAAYSISFKKPKGKAESWLLDLGEVQESATVTLNGTNIGTVIGPVYRLEVPTTLLKKKNTLEVKVSNSMANHISYLDKKGVNWKKFYNTNMPARLAVNRGADGLFTAAKWEPRKSGLIGPVTLTPLKTINPE